jgi:Straboviridae/Ackermannviridae/Kyanoviridae exonuclease subunit 1
MKVALIADTHYGIRSDSEYFLNNMKTFLDKIFFPYIDKHKIKKIIHVGDIVDRQKYINYNTASRLREDFLEPIQKRKISMDAILGNHDFYYKQITGVSAFKELLREYANIKTYYTATEVMINGLKVLYIPWLCNENKDASLKLIKKTKAPIVFGHLEISGFEMHKGVFHEGGDDPRIFRKFDAVYTGHFHHKSSFSNIHYLGAPGQFTWIDYGDSRGFHIFDTETRELEFIQNHHTAFEKVYYDDSGKDGTYLRRYEFGTYKKKFVKVIVQSKTNIPLFDEFMSRIEEQGPIDVVIVDDHLNLDLISDTLIETEAKDTLTIFREFIKQANTVVSSEKLDTLIVNLYQRALSQE